MTPPDRGIATPSWEPAAAHAAAALSTISPPSGPADAARDRPPATVDWFRVGNGLLEVDADTPELTRRFHEVLDECRDLPPADAVPVAACRARLVRGARIVWARFQSTTQVDALPFVLHVFPDRGYREVESPLPGWRALAEGSEVRPLALFRGEDVLLDAEQSWASLLGSYAFNRALVAQPGILFFHAASVALNGAGMLIAGAKAAGKSTLALTLASRGHDFLGDEIAAVDAEGRLLPVRRAVSIRGGPRSAAVDAALARAEHAVETFPDGAPRIRAEVRSLFPTAPGRPAPLRRVLLLRPFRDSPRLTAAPPSRELIPLLGPLPCQLWGSSLAPTMMRLVRLIHGVPVSFLEPGPPDATADMVEELAEEP